MKKLVVIDGKSVFYRGYYAMGALGLPDGTPTGGVYGFAAIAMEIVSDLRPDKVVVAWDSKTSTVRRREIFAEYKAGRRKPGDDFYAQIPLLKELILELGWNFCEVEEFEADDIIGTLARQADEDCDEVGRCRWETVIISSDMDMFQVVDENTRMYRILKGFSDIEEVDVAAIEAKYGILKSQFLDLKAIKGDASDNIPGVPGIGEKGAVKLLNEYGDLAGIYAHLDEIKGATRAKLEAGKESAEMSYRLAKIMTDAPVRLEEFRDFRFDGGAVYRALKKLQFNSLIRKFHLTDDELAGLDFDEPGKGREWKMGADVFEAEIVEWDVKEAMHRDERVAAQILAGAKFWDLNQGAFLLDPLARKEEKSQAELVFEDEAEKRAEYARQREEFAKRGELYKIFVQFDLPLIPVLYKMEKKGMLVNRGHFDELNKLFVQRAHELEGEIFEMAGCEFNVNSPMQLSDVLFSKLALPTKGIKKTSRGYSTGAKELAKLADAHPIVGKISEYREATKLLNTYITPLPMSADIDGRVHTTFTQNVTATGRLSSVNPNLQNIPVRTEDGKRIREGFVAPEGRVLVSADYAQFELRLAAVLGGDEKLLADFQAGVDIHTKTAAETFGVEMNEVTKMQRRAAKVINFGILYGMSPKGLADATGMTMGEAAEFIRAYFELRAPIREYLDGVLAKARDEGFVETFFGRRRPTPDVHSSNFVIRQAAERAAQNMPIQGTEADLMKRAMVRVDAELNKLCEQFERAEQKAREQRGEAGLSKKCVQNEGAGEGVGAGEGIGSGVGRMAELVMQVHDSLIVECDEDVADEVAEILRKCMTGVAPELKVRLDVDVTTGENWGEL